MLEIATDAERVRALASRSESPVIIGFFGNFSEASRRARPAFERFARGLDGTTALLVDVSTVRGVHRDFGVTGVPTVVTVKEGAVLRKAVGPRTAEEYERALLPHESAPRRTDGEGEKRPFRRVTVYVGEHCPWCRRLKSWLRRHRIPFREVDVSRDPSKARELQSRTGHTGVPQTEIDGRWVVGFDQARLSELLGIRGEAK